MRALSLGGELGRAGRTRADVIPIAEAEIENVVFRLGAEICDVALHALVASAEQFEIAGELVLLPWSEDAGAAPLGRVAERVGAPSPPNLTNSGRCSAPCRPRSTLECKGRVYDAAWQRELLTPDRPVIEPTATAPLLEVILRCHDWAQRDAEGAPELLASLGVHVLGLLAHGAGQVPGPRRALEQKLEKARRLLIERCDQPLDLPSLAKELGLGYSLLRQTFGRHSGQSARKFHTEARLRRACGLLANSTLSVKEIGDLLGYSSAFHFSAAFKAGRGCPPSEWRRRQNPAPGV